jgi:hypothetical protein
LKTEIIIPRHHEVMGAIGAALLARDEVLCKGKVTAFKGFEVTEAGYNLSSFECKACPNLCEIAQISIDGQILARWGGRCDLWEKAVTEEVK